MLTFIFALFFTIVASVLLERFSKPKAWVAKGNANTLILHSSIISILFIALTLIVQRSIFSGIALVVFFIIVIAVSNAKFKALKEPIVFSDFAMFSQAFKHPRLYFPFLGLAPVIIAPIIIIGLIVIVLTLEPAMAFTAKRIFLSLLAIIGIGFFSKSIAEELKLSANPEEDNARYGLINTLVAYTLQARSKEHKLQIVQTLQSSPFFTQDKNTGSTPPHFYMMDSASSKGSSEDNKPNITVIQSESFFDARRLHPAIKTDILNSFDTCKKSSLQYGKLKVPAWGANTMRSEFSFLTGLKYQDMGLYRYYPYQFIKQMSVSSIASALQAQGYYCVCIHPHPASFFGRDQLFPKLGFDEFIDIGSFEGAEKFGPYISDQAVTDKILEITEQMTHKPLFIFAITMENHGPLHLEKTTKQEQSEYYSDDKLGSLNDLTVYLRHLKNADKMIKALTGEYQNSHKETTLCFYGDHVPSMPDIYQATDYDDSHSDYFIWHSNATYTNKQEEITIESLANSVLAYSVQ